MISLVFFGVESEVRVLELYLGSERVYGFFYGGCLFSFGMRGKLENSL